MPPTGTQKPFARDILRQSAGLSPPRVASRTDIAIGVWIISSWGAQSIACLERMRATSRNSVRF